MKIINASARRGTGIAVTLTRKNSGTEHNPLPTTKRGKRRAARRGAAEVLDLAYAAKNRVLSMDNSEMLTDLGVTT